MRSIQNSRWAGFWNRKISLYVRQFSVFGFCVAFFLFAVSTIESSCLAQQKVDYNRDILPILADHCFACHGPDSNKREAKLRFDKPDFLSARSQETGKIVVRNSAEKSLLWQRISSNDDDFVMPPDGERLTKKQITAIKNWIEQGAGWKGHWLFQEVQNPPVPKVRQSDWPINSIDRFILRKLESADLSPSPAADNATLIRRLSLDLTGILPDQNEVAQFSRSTSPASYEQAVDRLLASPHFGERLAIYWLDLVRYADTVGYHGDQDHPVSPYRDYVISSFNKNISFQQFTIEQLAGDLLQQSSMQQKIASGYNRLLQTTHEGGAQDKEYLTKYAADRVRNVSSVWLGLTLGCAECHDHKFDALTQKDFYSLSAFFADIKERGNYGSAKRNPEMDVLVDLDEQLHKDVSLQIDQLMEQIRENEKFSRLDKGDDKDKLLQNLRNTLAEKQKELKKIQNRKRRTLITVSTKPRIVRILPRGDWLDQTGQIVEPDIPSIFGKMELLKKDKATRLDLANWISSRQNPISARVFVNRIWYLFFGEGLASPLDDYGTRGKLPTHPALLDHLATEFMNSGWDIKSLIRKIVLSRTYRQSSLISENHAKFDPNNRLFGRQNRFRIAAELIRDAGLKVSGLMLDQVGGKSTKPYQPKDYYAHLNFPKRKYKPDLDRNQFRRGLYVHWQRQFLHPMLKSFDAPSREECTAKRPVNNTPLSALALLNDPSFVEMARSFAVRILKSPASSEKEKVRWAWREAFSRDPNPAEVRLMLTFYKSNLKSRSRKNRDLSVGITKPSIEVDQSQLDAWTAVARIMLNLNEFIMRN